jgi:hypothetical protein
VKRVATWVLGSISALLLIYGVACLSLVSGYTALGPTCMPPPGNRCLPGITPDQVSIAPLLNSGPLTFALPLLALALVIGAPVWIGAVVRADRRGSSAQPLILVVSLLASALLIVDLFILFSELSPLSGAPACVGGAASQAPTCFTGTRGLLVALAGIGWGPLAGAILAGAPAWVMALTQTARWRQWRWFAAVLLLSPVAVAVYALFGPQRPSSRTAHVRPIARDQEPAPAL